MNAFSMKKNKKTLLFWAVLKLLFLLLTIALPSLLSSCKQTIDYSAYISELRANVFLAQTDGFALRVYSVTKESPYESDGLVREKNERTEFYLVAPQGNEHCQISFAVNGNNHGGEMSYDNVKSEYYFYCPVQTADLTALSVRVTYGEKTVEFSAKSVLNADTLSPFSLLTRLQTEEKKLFDSLTDKYGFAAEIRIRLIYEDSPYYYIGIIDRKGNTTAFLVNATSGKILAKRQN